MGHESDDADVKVEASTLDCSGNDIWCLKDSEDPEGCQEIMDISMVGPDQKLGCKHEKDRCKACCFEEERYGDDNKSTGWWCSPVLRQTGQDEGSKTSAAS